MDTEASVAIIVASIALIGTVFTAWRSAKKDDLEILRGIIDELKEKVGELEAENADLKAWAERLVCQVKDAGLKPVEFIRGVRERTKPRKE